MLYGVYSDQLSSSFTKAIADACKVSASFTSDLHESEVPNEYEQPFDEDQELQQIIDGKICMKIYHFLQGMWNNFSYILINVSFK